MLVLLPVCQRIFACLDDVHLDMQQQLSHEMVHNNCHSCCWLFLYSQMNVGPGINHGLMDCCAEHRHEYLNIQHQNSHCSGEGDSNQNALKNYGQKLFEIISNFNNDCNNSYHWRM